MCACYLPHHTPISVCVLSPTSYTHACVCACYLPHHTPMHGCVRVISHIIHPCMGVCVLSPTSCTHACACACYLPHHTPMHGCVRVISHTGLWHRRSVFIERAIKWYASIPYAGYRFCVFCVDLCHDIRTKLQPSCRNSFCVVRVDQRHVSYETAIIDV